MDNVFLNYWRKVKLSFATNADFELPENKNPPFYGAFLLVRSSNAAKPYDHGLWDMETDGKAALRIILNHQSALQQRNGGPARKKFEPFR
ncbi:MAG: hypothetical protein AAGF54_10560 [Pseudomonadota bacterium]